MNYYISDLHFGHQNILSFDNRPFETIEENDKTIVDKWNARVGIEDYVYLLGDISWYGSKKTIDFLKSMNGKKILIIGNHDHKLLKNKELRNQFIEIAQYLEVRDGERDIILSHYPIPYFNRHYYGAYMFYGHVHNTWEEDCVQQAKAQLIARGVPCNMINVGCMMKYMGFEPQTANYLGGIIDNENND